ncbi:MAG: hypothetical protein COW89_03335 [Nitrospinae bacterium CG22_combo_CG10-13_8_21_14_all_47_10]|nr:MAG: hypothetical protein COW89_03335 [Nitrospinae bacterium CG22_combo_CG10-13_8_21_14_all_47_10]
MRYRVSKYFNETFDLSHAAFFSIAVHLVFFSMHPFGIFDKPLVQEKKYKKVRLEVVKKPEVVPVPQKKLEVKRPVLPQKPLLSKPVAIPVSKPIRQVESKAINTPRPTVAPLINTAPKNFAVAASASIQKTSFKAIHYTAIPRAVNDNTQTSPYWVSSPIGKAEVGRFVVRGPRMNVSAKINNAPSIIPGAGNTRTARLASSGVQARLDRREFHPRGRTGKFDKLEPGSGGYSTLVATHGSNRLTFNPQIRSVAEIMPEQDQLSADELNNLWNGYTTKVRMMIARAKIYPPVARENGQQGKIHLSFKLGKNGEILKLLVEHSSGYEVLDEAARRAVLDAGPFPPIPEKLNKQYVLLKLPVAFILR